MTDDHKAEALDLDALAELATWNNKRSVHYADQAAEAWRSSTSGDHARMLETISAKHGDTADGILALIAALKEARAGLADAWDEGCVAGRNREHHTNMTREQAEATWPNPYRRTETP